MQVWEGACSQSAASPQHLVCVWCWDRNYSRKNWLKHVQFLSSKTHKIILSICGAHSRGQARIQTTIKILNFGIQTLCHSGGRGQWQSRVVVVVGNWRSWGWKWVQNGKDRSQQKVEDWTSPLRRTEKAKAEWFARGWPVAAVSTFPLVKIKEMLLITSVLLSERSLRVTHVTSFQGEMFYVSHAASTIHFLGLLRASVREHDIGGVWRLWVVCGVVITSLWEEEGLSWSWGGDRLANAAISGRDA